MGRDSTPFPPRRDQIGRATPPHRCCRAFGPLSYPLASERPLAGWSSSTRRCRHARGRHAV